MSDLSDVERDAERALQALHALAAHLSVVDVEPVTGSGLPLQLLADEGATAAERVLGYLRSLRRPGDGASAAHSARLGAWHDWCPRGGGSGVPGRTGRRQPGQGGDPGE